MIKRLLYELFAQMILATIALNAGKSPLILLKAGGGYSESILKTVSIESFQPIRSEE